ncbi:MAG: phosphoribosyltransferase [Atribacterota bacterium]
MKTKEDNILSVSEEKINGMINNLCRKIEVAEIDFNKIVGIANGGLNISIKLSDMLCIPHQQLRISYYEGDFEYNKQSFKHEHDDIVLLVDDLIDSGKTVKYFCDKYNFCQGQNLFVACLYYKVDNDHFQYANFYVEEKPDVWIQFPWEKN